MGQATGRILRTLRTSGRGSDFYGACEQCGGHMSEAFITQQFTERKRANGELYSVPIGGGVHGHYDCLQVYGPFDKVVTRR